MEQTIMTPEQRFERIENDLGRLAEMQRQDRADYLVWKRDMQSHVDAVWLNMERRDKEFRETMQSRDAEYRRMIQESNERFDRQITALDQRIGKLISAMGEFIAKQK
jgi:hypothetical protein